MKPSARVPDETPTVAVEFPLRGEWLAIHTPATRIPSHGTDILGQRYAYDFVRHTGSRWAPWGPVGLAQVLALVPVRWFAAWDAPVVAATAGRVVAATNDWPDRRWINGLWNLGRHFVVGRFRPVRITASDWRPLAGNYVVIEGAVGVAFYAHLRQGSVRVRVGDLVAAGDLIGSVGNSGRSTMPHLHFHLMDRSDSIHAKGIYCGFSSYQRWDGRHWQPASGVPGRDARIRVPE